METTTQWGNLRIFLLPIRFYVKLTLGDYRHQYIDAILTNLMMQKFDFRRFQLVLCRQFSVGEIVKISHCDQLATLQHLLDKDARSTISSSSS